MNTTDHQPTSDIISAHQQKQGFAPFTATSEQLAAQIREARRRQNITLKALSEKSGVSTSTLSKVENNLTSPSYQILQQLMQALGLKLPQLFTNSQGGITLSRRALTRKMEGVSHLSPSYEHRLLASELSQKKMLPFTSTIRARSLDACDSWVRHQGEEFLMVLRGAVQLHCECYEPLHLDTGDSCYLDSTMGHALVSVSKEDAEILWVASLS